jgi:hypothetical protein
MKRLDAIRQRLYAEIDPNKSTDDKLDDGSTMEWVANAEADVAWLANAEADVAWLLDRVTELTAAVEANHKWHQAYDDCDGYEGSELYEHNVSVLAKAYAASK